MRKSIIAGNWKMNKTLQEGISFVKELESKLKNKNVNCDVIVCVPFIHLVSIYEIIDTKIIKLGAQNNADNSYGAYTGEISAAMIASTGAKYVILGHSERRVFYKETNLSLKKKVELALKNNLIPIFCIGESLEERKSAKQNMVIETQMKDSLFSISANDFEKIILAYEPVWAIGTGETATSNQIQDMHTFIRKIIVNKYGQAVANKTSILYGGSCNENNAKKIFANSNVDGGLIGGASLKIDTFLQIIETF
ncbi:MAG: triose-phosphate isomerase [Bacteroidales bacterium OttesenSCG-928-I14]|jgi:triosephosphate isomerase|nr:triose-phosphate isomerase [Bacteroidales bacterium OttesenSCG-928-I14]